jgi:hypothetical protein
MIPFELPGNFWEQPVKRPFELIHHDREQEMLVFDAEMDDVVKEASSDDDESFLSRRNKCLNDDDDDEDDYGDDDEMNGKKSEDVL